MHVDFPIISADSHITEAPNTYLDYIDPAYVDVAPHLVETEDKGDIYVMHPDGKDQNAAESQLKPAGIGDAARHFVRH